MKIFNAKCFLCVLIVYVCTLSVIACVDPPCIPACNPTCQNCVNGECQPKPNSCNNCTNYITNPPRCREDGTYCIGSKLQKGSISRPSSGASVASGSSITLSASNGSDSDCHNTTNSCGQSCSESENDPVTVSWSASAGTFPSGNTGTSVQWQSPSGSGEVNITASWANDTNTDKYYESESQTITVKVVVPVPPEDPNNSTNQANGAKAKSNAPSTDPVTLTGEFNCYARDMVIKGRAMDVAIERSYRSDANDGVRGWRFGYSWDMSYNIKVRPLSDPDRIRLFDGTNRPIIYQRIAGSNPATYLPPAGRYDRIVKNGNGTYTLTEKDGKEYKFNAHNDIERIEDRNGNAITFGYDGSYRLTGITDDLNRTITLSYDSVSGLLSTITDFADRTWTYGYDLSNNLTSVTAPTTDDYPQGHWKLDETGTTTTAQDSSLYDRDGTLMSFDFSNDGWTTGRVDGGLDFDGTGYVTVGYDQDLNPDCFSISLWAKVEGNQGNWRSAISSRDYLNQLTSGYIIYAGSDNNWQFWTGNETSGWSTSWDTTYGSRAIQLNVWTHIAASFEPTGTSGNCLVGIRRLYINGLLAASETGTLYKPCHSTNRSLLLGAGANECTPYQYFFNGQLDDVRIYDRVLSQEEILRIAGGVGLGSHTTTYGYSGHNLTTITDPNGQTWLSNTYTDNKVSSQVYGTGTSNLEFHSSANYTTTTTRTEHVIDSVYNSAGLVTQETVYTEGLRTGDPASYVTQYQYDPNSELIRTTFPAGNYVTYAYDASGNMTCIAKEPNNDDPNIVTRFTYEATYNQIASITDPRGNETTFDYDSNGNLETITYPQVETPNGNEKPVVGFTYNAYGQVETITDPNGLVTLFEYYLTNAATGKGQIWKARVDPYDVDITTVYEYDVCNNVTKITDDGGAEYSFGYNELDQRISATNPDNITAAFKYNPNKMLEEIQRPIADANQITTYAYDLLDKVKTITDPLGYTTRYGFDAEHTVTDATDAEENNTHYDYDERGLLWKVTDANDGVTEYSYTPNGKIDTIADANDNVTTYEYDGFDRLKKVTYADDSDEEYGYDASGNLTSFTNRAGQTITFGYDAMNRLVRKTLPGNKVTTYLYDIAGRVVDVNDDCSHTCNAYDRFGSLAQTTSPNSKTVKYEYDNLGRRTKLTYPDNTYILYYYDAMSRLTDIKNQSNNLIVHYDYDALSRRTAATYGNNTSATYSYDLSNQLKWLVNDLDSDITFEYTAYDNVGNRTNMIMNSDESAYTYDTLYQLKTADYPSAWNIADTNCWYDQVGNWTSVYTGTTTTYSHNRLNQYTAVGSVTPTYDSRGNITGGYGGGLTLVYDCENRLTTAGSVSYAYDWLGRRVSRTVSGGTTTCVYDGGQIIAEYNGGTLLRKYIYGPGIDEPVCMVASGGTYYYHFDGLGSVAALTGSGGTLIEKYRYDAFGATTILAPNNQTRTTSLYGNRFMFTGREWDSTTQLYYYRARDYSPTLGRFLQTDPIGYADSMNLYQYCGNNPVNFVDPWGLLTSLEDPRGAQVVEELMPGTNEGIRQAVQSTPTMSRFRGLMLTLWMIFGQNRPGETLPGPGKGGPPNGSVTEDRGNGNVTTRHYGPDGKPTVDYDSGHDHGYGDPHQHRWNGDERGKGEPIPAIVPKESDKTTIRST